MSWLTWVFLILAFGFNSVANVLLKLGSRQGLVLSNLSFSNLILANWQVWLGCLLFAANVPFYFLALRSMPISIAYPIMVVMSFLIINLYAVLFLGEHLVGWQILGYFCLIVGLLLVVLNNH